MPRRPPRRPGAPKYPPQYNVPSQAPAAGLPYNPEIQPDVQDFPILQRRHPPGTAPYLSYVVTTYDARPIQAHDFLVTDGVSSQVGVNTVEFSFETPIGRVRAFKSWSLEARLIPDDQPLLNPEGFPSAQDVAVMSVIVNGVFQEGFSGVNIPLLVASGSIESECYFLVDEGQTLTFRLSTFGFITDAQLMMYGNSLLSTELPIEFEPGTTVALPVTARRTDKNLRVR